MSKQEVNTALIRLGKAIERMKSVEPTPELDEIMSEIAHRYWQCVNAFVALDE